MPANPERRMLITDTAIEILAEVGAGGLTHRLVDTKAGLPRGTTSNFFRTRLALLQATTQRVAELHWQHVAEMRSAMRTAAGRDGVARLLGLMLGSTDEVTRVRSLARFELFLEGNRRPELKPVLVDIHNASMQAAAVVISSGGVPTRPERVRLLSRLLTGLAFDQLTLPDTPLTADEATALISRLLDAVFG